MDAKGYVTQMLDLSHGRLREAIDGVSEAEARRVMAGKLAPVVWQVGHLALVDGIYVRRAGGQSPVPDRYTELFKQGSGGEQDYPPISEVWGVFDTAHRALVDRASGADYEAALPATGTTAPAYKTVGQMLLYSTYHRGYHIGKIMSLRGLLGKTPLR
ncbi:MAG TPA: DinB family protein [bacterium]|nr:DinB family protein [bacterium]